MTQWALPRYLVICSLLSAAIAGVVSLIVWTELVRGRAVGKRELRTSSTPTSALRKKPPRRRREQQEVALVLDRFENCLRRLQDFQEYMLAIVDDPMFSDIRSNIMAPFSFSPVTRFLHAPSDKEK